MTDRRIIDLQEGLSSDAYLLTDSVTNGTKKYAVSDMIDKAANEALGEVSQITSQASSAAAQATDAKNAAQAATTAANNATNAANDAVTAANAAIDAIGDISELAVPLMSTDVRGGAKLGDGLQVTDEKLSIGSLAKSDDGSNVNGCAIMDVNASGWAEQDSTTGKNLLDPSQGALTDGSSITASGVTFARDNNVITISGTATAEYPQSALVEFNDSLNFEVGQTYTISKNVVNVPSGGILYLIVYENDVPSKTGQTTLATLREADSKTFTPTKPYTHIIVVAQGNGVSWSNATIYAQIETGSTATSYEPYSGGKASPSPEYPQEIKVCRGRNLIDESTLVMGNVDANGNLTTTSTNYVRTGKIDCKPNTGYVVQTSYAANAQLLIHEWASDGTYIGMNGGSSTRAATVIAFITSSTAAFMCVMFRHASSPAVVSDFVGGCQLELGSTPTPYVPYGHVGLEVESTPTTLYKSDYAISENGTETANSTFDIMTMKAIGGKSMMLEVTAPPYIVTRVHAYDKYGNWLAQLASVVESASAMFSIPSNAVELRFSKNKGATASVTTTTPIPLPLKSDGERWAGGLPDGTADALSVDSAGRYEWTCPTDEKVFDGSETWSVTKSGTENWYYSLSGASNLGIKGSSPFLSNQYTGATITNSNTSQGIGTTSTGSDLRVRYGTEQAAADFAASHVTNPLTALYALATPTAEHGYIDLPIDIPEGSTITIPELENFNIRYMISAISPILEYTKNNYTLSTMSPEIKGGAKLGSGLTISDDKLSLGNVVSDSTDGPIYSASARGWAEQDSTTGKNLLSELEQGGFDSNGLNTSGTNRVRSKDYIGVSEGEQYVFLCDALAGKTVNVGISWYSASDYSTARISATNWAQVPFTVSAPSGAKYARVLLKYTDESSVTPSSFPHSQLEAGSTATEYEPYSGAKPSPSPEYAQEIRVARGRNLLDLGSGPSDYSNSAIINGVSGNAVLVNVVDSGNTLTYRTQRQTAVGRVTVSAIASYTNSRFFVRLRNESDTAWLTGNEATIDGMTYNQFYGGWFVDNGNTLKPQITFDIPDCLYWEFGVGWNSLAAIVGTVQTLTDLQLELGTTPTPYVPYGHVGLEVQGRNLLDTAAFTARKNINDAGVISDASATQTLSPEIPVQGGKSYTFSVTVGSSGYKRIAAYDANGVFLALLMKMTDVATLGVYKTATFTAPADAACVRVSCNTPDLPTVQLERGTTPTAYEPYTHTTTPLPLPAKGWAGGLPDGTADALSVDSAGRWEWTDATAFLDVPIARLNDESYPVVSASGARAIVGAGINATWPAYRAMGSIGSSSSVIIGFNTSGSNDGTILPKAYYGMGATEWKERFPDLVAKFLLPLATPTAEHGYIDLPDVPERATIEIPELKKVGIKCFVPGARELAEHATNWGRRLEETESRIQQLEITIAALATS